MVLPSIPHCFCRQTRSSVLASDPHTVALVAHATTPNRSVRALRATLRRARGTLAVSYALEADLDLLRIPAVGSRTIGPLWRHTCLELFIMRPGESAYFEMNFAPSGECAAYAFERYRDGMRPIAQAFDPAIRVRCTASVLELEAEVMLDRLSPDYTHGVLALGIAAVIEDTSRALSYWALAHPRESADFHDARAFTLVVS